MKEWLKKRSHFSHENLLRELEISFPLDYRVYLWMFSSTSGELLEVITSFIQKMGHDRNKLLWNTSNQTLYCQHISKTTSDVQIACSCMGHII